MQRVTITLDDALMAELDTIIAARGYRRIAQRRSAISPAPACARAAEDVGQKRECVAALVYTYDHAARQLSKRLTTAYHEHHELSLASLHVHLDHDTCLEVTVLKGRTEDLQQFGEHVIAERGVRHGKIVRMPVELAPMPHRASHDHDGEPSSPSRRGGEETGRRRPKRARQARR